ncbi:MAG: tetratricopeptide repeat protein [Candidatus Thorarchaeota archaeon]
MVQERNIDSRNEHDEVEVRENTPEEWFKMACYLTSRGKQKEAEVAIKNALNVREDYPIAWAILSAIRLSQGQETDAEEAGKKAISQCKELKITWPKMRSIIYSKGVIRGASWKDPRRVVIDASDSTEWGNLLVTLGKSSNQDLGEIASTQVTLDDKDESQSLASSSKEYTPEREIEVTEKKKYTPFEKLFDSHEDRVDKVESELEPMKVYGSTREIDRTEKRYESAEERFESPQQRATMKPVADSQASVLFTKADSLLKKGNLDAALDTFRQALKLDSSNGPAWFRLSSLLAGKHKYDEAIVALEYATEKMPKNALAWYQLGYCYQKLNKWSDAIPPLKQATLLEKLKPDFWMALGLSEFHLGQYQFAAKSLLRVLRMSPNHKKALFYLAMCMERQGNRKHSLSLYIKLLNVGGLKPAMLERMAGAFERLNRPREARECRRRAQVGLRAGIR